MKTRIFEFEHKRVTFLFTEKEVHRARARALNRQFALVRTGRLPVNKTSDTFNDLINVLLKELEV
jgi:hypothetical protein